MNGAPASLAARLDPGNVRVLLTDRLEASRTILLPDSQCDGTGREDETQNHAGTREFTQRRTNTDAPQDNDCERIVQQDVMLGAPCRACKKAPGRYLLGLAAQFRTTTLCVPPNPKSYAPGYLLPESYPETADGPCLTSLRAVRSGRHLHTTVSIVGAAKGTEDVSAYQTTGAAA